MITLKAFRYRIYPNKEQESLLNKTFGCVRVVWNHNVEVFNSYDKELAEQRIPLTSTELRRKHEWMKEVSASAVQQKAMDFRQFKQNFFSKTRKGKIGRPSFKKKDAAQSFRLPNQKFTLGENSIRLEKIGTVKLVMDRPVPSGSKFMSVTVSKNKCNQLFASVLVETGIAPKPKTGAAIGIDVGLKIFIACSDGATVENPKFFRESQTKLARAQKLLSRKKKGSWRRKAAKLKVARIHNYTANQRKDFLHKLTTRLTSNNDFIAIEDLNVAGMVKNHKLAKSITDASWAEFTSMLDYKAAWYGKEVVRVDRWFASSKLCSACGEKKETLTLQERTFNCEACGFSMDRDENASRNILTEALRVSNAIRTQSKGKTLPVETPARRYVLKRLENHGFL
jgi:transposase, IS605 OrfB family, central region